MTPSDDILDLLGRYATGSLTEHERQRLFDAALNDQELFEELAREQELKMALQQPGARDRMIRALGSPPRKVSWIMWASIAAALGVVTLVYVTYPSPKPEITVATTATTSAPIEIAKSEPAPAPAAAPQVAKQKAVEQPVGQPVVDQPPANRPAAPVEVARSEPVASPAAAPPPLVTQKAEQPAVDELAKDAKRGASAKDASKKDASTVIVAQAPAIPAASRAQGIVGGPRQQQLATQNRVAAEQNASFGFHYNADSKGHLIIVPGADGYLFVKSNDGKVIYGRKQIAAAITTDVPVPDGVTSLVIVFSQDATPAESAPVNHQELSAEIVGPSPLIVQVKLK